jgi:ribosomal protein S15P/S13E
MTKKLFFIAMIAILFSACNNTSVKEEQTQANEPQEIVQVTVEDFLDDPAGFVGKTITIEGTVVHTCKHGGKKMFIVGEESEDRVKITAGDDVPAFDSELEGSDVIVTGTVEEMKVDEAFLSNRENEIKTGGAEGEMKLHQGGQGHEGEEEDADAQLEQINNLRQQLKESGKDHLSFYSIEAIEYKEKK